MDYDKNHTMIYIIKKYLFIFVVILFIPLAVYTFDFSFSKVKLDKFSEKIYYSDVSEYRIISADSEFVLPDTPFQKVLKKEKEKNNFILSVRTGNFNRTVSPPSRDYLTDTRFLDFKDPEINNLRKRFKGSKNLIDDVERFVNNHINKKTMGIPLVSASQIFKNRTGDCTEHTVLCAAILRSLGIPVRALVGMLLSREFGEYRNVFVYHMWAEAYINGRWILIDATRPGGKYQNRYIAFCYHHLKTEMPLSYLKAISAMKSFSVEYVDE